MTPVPAPAVPRLGRATLAVIDMQTAFRDSGSEWAVPRYDEVSLRIERLVEDFGDHVVWTRFVRDPAERGAWSDYYDRWSSFRIEEDSVQWDLTLPTDGQPVISLPTFSKWGPELAAASPQDEPLVVCGVATDCCVLATVLGAVDAGRSVVVVTDACAAVSDDAQEQTLHILGLLSPMVRLVTTDQVSAAARVPNDSAFASETEEGLRVSPAGEAVHRSARSDD